MFLLVAGNAVGLLLRLQKRVDGLKSSKELSTGHLSPTAEFVLTPLIFVGAIGEGIFGDPRPFWLKAGVDGLLALTVVERVRGGLIVVALLVGLLQGALVVLLDQYSHLVSTGSGHAIGMVAGLLLLCSAVAIADVRRVNSFNYLPALFLAPLIGRWW
jgi:uncharacterized membrane protein YqgA involved in biofilm formation